MTELVLKTDLAVHLKACRLQSSPFFLSQPANYAQEASGVRCAAAKKRAGRVPRGRASHTSRLPRVVRWLGDKKRDCLAV